MHHTPPVAAPGHPAGVGNGGGTDVREQRDAGDKGFRRPVLQDNRPAHRDFRVHSHGGVLHRQPPGAQGLGRDIHPARRHPAHQERDQDTVRSVLRRHRRLHNEGDGPGQAERNDVRRNRLRPHRQQGQHLSDLRRLGADKDFGQQGLPDLHPFQRDQLSGGQQCPHSRHEPRTQQDTLQPAGSRNPAVELQVREVRHRALRRPGQGHDRQAAQDRKRLAPQGVGHPRRAALYHGDEAQHLHDEQAARHSTQES